MLASLSLGHLHLFVTTLSSSMPFSWHSLSSSGCLSSFSNGNSVSLPPISFITFLCSIQTPLLVLSLLISLLNFHLCWLILSFDCSVLSNVTGAYHLELRRQYKYIFYSLCMSWITGAQWPAMEGFKGVCVAGHWQWCASVFYLVIYRLKS